MKIIFFSLGLIFATVLALVVWPFVSVAFLYFKYSDIGSIFQFLGMVVMSMPLQFLYMMYAPLLLIGLI